MPDEATSNMTAHDRREHGHTVTGHRLCAECGYVLTGQRIVREPQYGILTVRCPECGTFAAVQEQPVLGRWAGRWAMVLLVLWLVGVLFLVLAETSILAGFARGLAETASQPLGQQINERFVNSLPEDHEFRQQRVYYGYYYGNEFDQWWNQQDADAILADAGGLASGLSAPYLLLLIPFAALATLIGVIAALMLVHWSRKKLLIAAAGLMAVTFGWGWLFSLTIGPDQWSGFSSAFQAAATLIAPTYLFGSIALGGVFIFLGAFVGRPFVRLLVRVLLPPRMQVSLSQLWLTDKKPPPAFPR